MIDDCNINNLAKNQVSTVFKVSHPNLQRFVWDAMLVPIQIGTNMAAGNQQNFCWFPDSATDVEHLSLSFARKA